MTCRAHSGTTYPVIAEVIASYGRHLLLRDADGGLHKARPLGRMLDIVCGDNVQCEWRGDELLVAEILPRKGSLMRSTLRGRSELVAANLTQLAVVLAPVPAADLFLLDRYLCAAESASLRALIVINKNDMPDSAKLHQSLSGYVALGYDTISISANAGVDGIGVLAPALAGHTTILAGQSGVGKSTLSRLLTDEAVDIAVGALMREEEGRHTTTASRLYDCRSGGRIIDSPGVRDFAPAIDALEPATLGFRELAQRAGQCRFLDCRHMQEPGCAVRAATETGAMDPRRYESYRRLRRLYEELWEKRSERDRAARR
jgi:ribosome biogenesis GTPase / thiamine phosphate phosphatase